MIRVLALLFLLGGVSWSQEADEVRTKFYDFDELNLQGDRKKPATIST